MPGYSFFQITRTARIISTITAHKNVNYLLHKRQIKKTSFAEAMEVKAETEGFEPSIELPLYTLSKRAPSATRTSLQRSANLRGYLHTA